MRLAGKRALITGGASGIGRAVAERFTAEGALVCVADIEGARAQETAAQIVASGGQATALPVDVTRPEQVERLVGRVVALWDRVDVLVNSAGIKGLAAIDDLTPDTWRSMLAVHLEGTFLCSRAVLPSMRASGGGRIINLASMVAGLAMRDRTAYVAAKGGVVAFTKALAWELSGTGITVNAISPGFIEVQTLLLDRLDDRLMDQVLAMTPSGRLGRPEDVAGAAVYLASDEAGFVNGSVLSVDGGWSAGKEPL